MTIAQQIAQILKNRAIKLKLAEDLLTKSDDALSDDDQATFDTLTKEVEDYENKLLNLEKFEKNVLVFSIESDMAKHTL